VFAEEMEFEIVLVNSEYEIESLFVGTKSPSGIGRHKWNDLNESLRSWASR